MKQFYLPTRIVTGNGCFAELGKQASQFGERTMLVCGARSLRASGQFDRALELLRAVDEILIDEIKSAGLYRKISQALAVLMPISTVGVMGDERSYENVVAIRAVETPDFMTADFSQIPYEVLGVISNRIINEVRGINRVVYDISSKPPATIEWE